MQPLPTKCSPVLCPKSPTSLGEGTFNQNKHKLLTPSMTTTTTKTMTNTTTTSTAGGEGTTDGGMVPSILLTTKPPELSEEERQKLQADRALLLQRVEHLRQEIEQRKVLSYDYGQMGADVPPISLLMMTSTGGGGGSSVPVPVPGSPQEFISVMGSGGGRHHNNPATSSNGSGSAPRNSQHHHLPPTHNQHIDEFMCNDSFGNLHLNQTTTSNATTAATTNSNPAGLVNHSMTANASITSGVLAKKEEHAAEPTTPQEHFYDFDDDYSRSPPVEDAFETEVLRVRSNSLIIAMVGLPGRGKSFISTRLCRWLNWRGVPAQCFNAGKYRRQICGAEQTRDPKFFDPDNEEAASMRELMAQKACEDLILFLRMNPGGVGILDATNTTKSRRQKLLQTFEGVGQVLFVESVCTDAEIIHSNILRAKCGNDDYVHVDPRHVLQDFYNRISQYEKVYETLCPDTERNLSFIKLVNVKTEVILHRLTGYLQGNVAFFLLNLHLSDQPVFLTRSGWSDHGENGVLGHDCELNEGGWRYALAVKSFLDNKFQGTDKKVSVMCSPMLRATQSANVLQSDALGRYHVQVSNALAEMNYGDYTGKTRSQCVIDHPITYAKIQQNPFLYSYPRGEGYKALARRLDPIFMELQRLEEPTVIVSHKAVLQVLRAYLMDTKSPEDAHLTDVPLGCVIEVTQSKNVFSTTIHDLREVMEHIPQEAVLEAASAGAV